MLGFAAFVVLVFASLVLVPAAAFVGLSVVVASPFDWLRRRRARHLAAVAVVEQPLRATLGPGGLRDDAGPLALAAPLRTWQSSWRDTFRRSWSLEIHGVVVGEQTFGGYRLATARTVVAPPAGATVIHAFVGRRHEHERRLAGVVVTGDLVRLFVVLAITAATCVSLVTLGALVVDFGMG